MERSLEVGMPPSYGARTAVRPQPEASARFEVVGATEYAQARVWLLVDNDNIFYSLEKGQRLNHRPLLKLAESLGSVEKAILYLGVRKGDTSKRKFIWKMEKLGFHVIARALQPRENARDKSDIDTLMTWQIAVGAMNDELDVLILVTGDHDFVAPVEKVIAKGIRVFVIGTKGSTAHNLKRCATQFWYTTEVDGLIKHTNQRLGRDEKCGNQVTERQRIRDEELLAQLLVGWIEG